jgi:hypothetical protein
MEGSLYPYLLAEAELEILKDKYQITALGL